MNESAKKLLHTIQTALVVGVFIACVVNEGDLALILGAGAAVAFVIEHATKGK